MIIKPSQKDAALLAELGAETFYVSHSDSSPPHEIASYIKKVYSLEAMKQELANPRNIYHLIKHDERVAGYSKMELNMKHSAIAVDKISKMDQIYLLESFQGLKLGAKLLQYNIEYSKAQDENGMWLVVWEGNATAISFYQKFGFQIVKSDKFRLTDTHLNPCYIMFLKYDNN